MGNSPILAATVRETLASTFGLELATVPEDLTQQTCAAWSSLNHMVLLAALEEQFAVRFTLGEMMSMQSLSSIVGALAARGVA